MAANRDSVGNPLAGASPTENEVQYGRVGNPMLAELPTAGLHDVSVVPDDASDFTRSRSRHSDDGCGHRVCSPFFDGVPGVPSDPDPAAVCAPAAPVKKWQGLN